MSSLVSRVGEANMTYIYEVGRELLPICDSLQGCPVQSIHVVVDILRLSALPPYFQENDERLKMSLLQFHITWLRGKDIIASSLGFLISDDSEMTWDPYKL